ncbi:MAG TPA: GtrA family protein [Candidatus Saccharibacteria bacterium]|nr:GtrA family protein [Candidatus Saccharibacteria bacterium]
MRRPSKATWLQFLYYNLGGTAFFVVGYAVFALLYGLLHFDWVVAKVVSDGLGWLSNYGVQRYLAFHRSTRGQSHLALMKRLIPLSLFDIPLDYAIVGGLKWLGVSPFIGLVVSSAFFTIWKWIWYKYWVFAKH